MKISIAFISLFILLCLILSKCENEQYWSEQSYSEQSCSKQSCSEQSCSKKSCSEQFNSEQCCSKQSCSEQYCSEQYCSKQCCLEQFNSEQFNSEQYCSEQPPLRYKIEQRPLLYNKDSFFVSNTTSFSITSPSSLTLSYPFSFSRQYFVLSNIALLFSQVEGIQQSSTLVSTVTGTVKVSIYLDVNHLLTQYIIDVSSYPIYSDTPETNCGIISSTCIGSCDTTCNTDTPVKCSYPIPLTITISSSQFYSFSPQLLIQNNTSIYVQLDYSSNIYFKTLYLSYTLLNF